MDKQREDFEAWYEAAAMPAESYWFKRDPVDPDYYDSVAVQSAWEGWQAALASRGSYIVAASSETLKEFVNSPDVLTPGAVQWVRNDPPSRDAEPSAIAFRNRNTGDFKYALSCPPDVESEWDDVYTAPPSISAAVAAAIEQAAKVLDRAALPYANGAGERNRDEFRTRTDLAAQIRALQTEDGLAALRNMLTRMHVLTVKHFEDTSISVNDLIERVMKGE